MTEMLVRHSGADRTFAGLPRQDARWRDEIDEELVCTQVVQVTHDVKSFVLASTHSRLFRFQAGQYLTLTLDVDGRSIDRCYTISSSPLTPDRLTITVKRVPGGPVSNWLHDNLVVGGAVAATGPLGRFTAAQHPASSYLFLSAGSGITPLMSMTRLLRAAAQPVDLLFVHSARTPEDIIFRPELESIAAGDSRTQVAVVCEQDSAGERWEGRRGLLSLPMLLDIAPRLGEREIFTCGPPPYMAAVRSMLAAAGVDPERCHEESFTFEGSNSPISGHSPGGARRLEPEAVGGDSTAAGSAVKTFSVELRRRGRTIECDSTTTILEAASNAGLSLPSSCGEGLCGTCKTTMLCGNVEMSSAGGIRPREVAANKILLCCSTPREDLILDA